MTIFYQAVLCSLPRIRGGVSTSMMSYSMFAKSSPHTRGCFRVGLPLLPQGHVFPAYAGVFPDFDVAARESSGLPRIRGGVSHS